MKELGITKGKWAITRSGMDWVVRANPTAIARIYSSWECEDADAELICDAGNTAQKCGLLPSELLQQRDELKEALISLMWQFVYYGTKNNVAVMHTGGLSALEDAFSALGLSDPITVENFEAAIKNTER